MISSAQLLRLQASLPVMDELAIVNLRAPNPLANRLRTPYMCVNLAHNQVLT
jgi:hypothetical protein